MKYVHYNDTKVLGFYDPEVHRSIPEPSFAISDEVWMAYLADQSSYEVQGGQLVYAPVVPPEPTPAEMQVAALAALDAEYQPQRQQLWDYLNLAVNYWQDATFAADIRTELGALEAEYSTRVEAITNGGTDSGGTSGEETLP